MARARAACTGALMALSWAAMVTAVGAAQAADPLAARDAGGAAIAASAVGGFAVGGATDGGTDGGGQIDGGPADGTTSAPSSATEASAPARAGGPDAITPARAAELQHMVVQDCGSCHGLTMKGGLGKPITPADLAGFDAEGLAAIILDGVPGTAMPPWRPLITEAEALWIADYLKQEKVE